MARRQVPPPICVALRRAPTAAHWFGLISVAPGCEEGHATTSWALAHALTSGIAYGQSLKTTDRAGADAWLATTVPCLSLTLSRLTNLMTLYVALCGNTGSSELTGILLCCRRRVWRAAPEKQTSSLAPSHTSRKTQSNTRSNMGGLWKTWSMISVRAGLTTRLERFRSCSAMVIGTQGAIAPSTF